MPPLTIERFRQELAAKIAKYEIRWEVLGFQAPDGKVYPFGTDTKVLSTVFETLTAPLIREIVDENQYTVESSDQTVYPDFTLSPAGGTPRIAIDIKTTYRKFNRAGQVCPFRYTLGSFTSFLRSPGATKNIKYPYKEYDEHWVIGFLYTRRVGTPAKVYYRREELAQMPCPYQDVDYFVQEKYRIVGLTPASGNTANIGSFPTSNIEDLRRGNGPFATYGKTICDEYWRNYGKKKKDRAYNDIEQFLEWQRINAPAVE